MFIQPPTFDFANMTSLFIQQHTVNFSGFNGILWVDVYIASQMWGVILCMRDHGVDGSFSLFYTVLPHFHWVSWIDWCSRNNFEYHSKECPSQKQKHMIAWVKTRNRWFIIAFAAMISVAAAACSFPSMRFSSQSQLSFLLAVVVKYHQHFVFWQTGRSNLHLNHKCVLCSSACLWYPISARTRTKDKYRVVYSDHQRLELEKEFHYSRYITIRRKAELANGIGLSERQVRLKRLYSFSFCWPSNVQVKIWFQNRRAKERRSLKKQDDVMLKDKLDSPSLGAFSPPMGPMDHFPPSSMGLGMGLPHGLPQPHHFPQGLHGAQHFGLMKFEWRKD